MEVHNNFAESWRVTLVDTGLITMMGGRVKRIEKYVGDEPFLLAYGGGVSNIDIGRLVAYHQSHGKLVTITTVNVGQRFGVLDVDEKGQINAFREKSGTDGNMINGGFMVMEPKVFDYIANGPIYIVLNYGLIDFSSVRLYNVTYLLRN